VNLFSGVADGERRRGARERQRSTARPDRECVSGRNEKEKEGNSLVRAERSETRTENDS